MQKNFKRYNEALTTEAKNIFGDIVSKAYIAVSCWGDTGSELIEYFNNELSTNTTWTKDSIIELDDSIIVIDFVNGKSVSFYSSEWATIKPAEGYEDK